MPQFVALFRGINVGRAKRVAMADLRTLLEGADFRDVRTLLNSGNVVFTAKAASPAAHAKRIRSLVSANLHIDAEVIVIPAVLFEAIAAENPLTRVATNSSLLLVAFPSEAGSLDRLAKLKASVRTPEQLAIGAHAGYLWCPDGSLQSVAGKALLGPRGEGITTRNWATVEKILTLLRT